MALLWHVLHGCAPAGTSWLHQWLNCGVLPGTVAASFPRFLPGITHMTDESKRACLYEGLNKPWDVVNIYNVHICMFYQSFTCTLCNGCEGIGHDGNNTGRSLCYTVYPKKYAHVFVVLCFAVVMQSFIINSHEVLIHIHQGCFAGIGAIVRLPQYQWSKPDGYGKISQCITTTKHSKAKAACIFFGIYCKLSSLTEPHDKSLMRYRMTAGRMIHSWGRSRSIHAPSHQICKSTGIAHLTAQKRREWTGTS